MNDQGLANVSRETNARLTIYANLLRKWNPRINLVSRASLDDLWTRHIADSAQLYNLAPCPITGWADLGSGGGFPGAVAAILAQEIHPEAEVTLVESDQRKCAFLRTVLRETGCRGRVIADRIEAADPLNAAVLSARALADLPTLLSYAERHMAADGTALFLKGATWQQEVDAAQSSWHFSLDVATSATDPTAAILKISGVSRV